jgi:hypothetical protein
MIIQHSKLDSSTVSKKQPCWSNPSGSLEYLRLLLYESQSPSSSENIPGSVF